MFFTTGLQISIRKQFLETYYTQGRSLLKVQKVDKLWLQIYTRIIFMLLFFSVNEQNYSLIFQYNFISKFNKPISQNYSLKEVNS